MQKTLILKAQTDIPSDLECNFFIGKKPMQYPYIHSHDYYEIFLITSGSIVHNINGEKHVLSENTVIFVRDRDEHRMEVCGNRKCEYINITFSKRVLEACFNMINTAVEKTYILEDPVSPCVSLTRSSLCYYKESLDMLNTLGIKNRRLMGIRLKAIITELISVFIMDLGIKYKKSLHWPGWLYELHIQSQDKEVFSEGLSALLRISGKNKSYLCRCFKKYIGATPTAYINSLRLSLAKELLQRTDNDIAEVIFECGFENVSHFYHLFKQRYNCTPKQIKMLSEN